MVLFWFLLTTLIIIAIQNILFRRLGFRKVEYTRQFVDRTCFQGDTTLLVETLSNKKRLPIPWLYVESSLEAALQFSHQDNFSVSKGTHYQNHQSYFTLSSDQRIKRTHALVPMRRGVYNLQTVTLTSGDLLGISRQSKQIPLDSQLIVYPKPITIPFDRIPYHSWQGDQIVKRFIMPDPFITAGTRPYQYGDSLKAVNWKATARTGALQVHQYEFTANRKLLIIVNVDDNEGMWRAVSNIELIERSINVAAGVAKLAIDQGMECGFAANMRGIEHADSVWVAPARGDGQWYGMLEVMAQLLLERTEPLNDMLLRYAEEGLSQHDIFIISTYWNEANEQAAQQLRRNQNAVLVLQTDELSEDLAKEAVQ
ncbi:MULTISPECIES: DUF58 domain-containing protein [Paenibacillus]|uniref:DUF58 domain-containing protein n=1 Tax=Paenibacillus TaxID=44249 RepID=UPI0020410923|nr:DUF58 domain-containing protein [Paenibacillus camelliae]MCM3631764.1 DUF58 domain-containing protein [Paenibacillus camelliae]